MKAKQYANVYEQHRHDHKDESVALSLFKIAEKMVIETGDIMKARGCKKNASVANLIRETEKKWWSFLDQVDCHTPLTHNLVLDLLHTIVPETQHLLYIIRPGGGYTPPVTEAAHEAG